MSIKIKKEIAAYETKITLNCILSVINVRGNKKEMIADCHLVNNDKIVESISYLFTPSLEGDNFIKQAYLHLKSLPEYADAIDC